MYEEMLRFFGLTENFTIQELKKQFRYLSKKYHPDNCSKTGIKLEDSIQKFTQTMEYYDYLTAYLTSKSTLEINHQSTLREYQNKIIVKLNDRINNELTFQQQFKQELTLSQKYKAYYLIYQKNIKLLIDYYKKLIEILTTDTSVQSKQTIQSYIKSLKKYEAKLKNHLEQELFNLFKKINYEYYESLSFEAKLNLEQDFSKATQEKSLRAIFLRFLQRVDTLPNQETNINQDYQSQLNLIFDRVNEIIMHIISRCQYHPYYQILLPEINIVLSHYDLKSLKKRLTTILSKEDQEALITKINQEIANQINDLFLAYQKFTETKTTRINNLIYLVNHTCGFETRKKLLKICNDLQTETRQWSFESQEKILHSLLTGQIEDYDLTKEEFLKLKKMANDLDLNKRAILIRELKFKDSHKKIEAKPIK